jgi:hypothetical protein
VALRFERIWGPSVCCDRSFAQRRSGFRLQAPASLTPAKRLNLWPPRSETMVRAFNFAADFAGSFDFAQDFGSGLGRPPNQAKIGLAGEPRQTPACASTCGPQGSRGSEGLHL